MTAVNRKYENSIFVDLFTVNTDRQVFSKAVKNICAWLLRFYNEPDDLPATAIPKPADAFIAHPYFPPPELEIEICIEQGNVHFQSYL